MPKHLLTLKELTSQEIQEIIEKAIEIKRSPQKYLKILEGKTLAMIFQKTSTRTRCSFEVAMTQLGGHAIYLDWRTTQFPLASIEDEIRSIASYTDIIMARLLKHEDLKKMARVSPVPLINGLCEKYHPCQILADLMTVREKRGKLEGLTLVYIGIANNISNTLTIGCPKLRMNFILCAPERHPPSLDQELIEEAKKTGFYYEIKNPKEAIKTADIIYTDTWVDVELFLNPEFINEKKRRIEIFKPYQINQKLLEGSSALIMHDMPIHEGYEITREVIENPNSIIFEQSENRLHSSKAIILKLLGKN